MTLGFIKAGLLTSTVGLAATEMFDPITAGELIGQMSVVSVFATVAMFSIFGLCRYYKDTKADRDKLLVIIEENARINQHVADLLADIKESLRK